MRRRVQWFYDEKAGAVLRQFREDLKVEQKLVARKLGVANSHISRIERGEQVVSVGEFLAWCEILGVDPAALVKQVMGKSE